MRTIYVRPNFILFTLVIGVVLMVASIITVSRVQNDCVDKMQSALEEMNSIITGTTKGETRP